MTRSVAFLFPGQGAQYVGMGKSVYDASPDAKRLFNLADNLLGFSLSELCFQGPEEALTETANAQVAIFVTSLATLHVLRAKNPVLEPSVVCGLSLGEWTALVACESLSFEDGLRLVRKRAELMNAACKENPGTMASVLGLPLPDCQSACEKAGTQVANINAPGQIVVSGTQRAVADTCKLAQELGAKVIPLKVSGAFHSQLMASAQRGLLDELKTIVIQKPKTTFLPNVTGEPLKDPERIRELLGRQVTEPVQWIRTMETLGKLGTTEALEIGPGNVLRGLAKRNKTTFTVTSIESENDVVQWINSTEGAPC